MGRGKGLFTSLEGRLGSRDVREFSGQDNELGVTYKYQWIFNGVGQFKN